MTSGDGDARADTATPRLSVLAAAVATLGVAVFAPALSGGFVYDDRPLIADNVHAHSLSGWSRWFTHDFWDVNEEVKHFGARMIYWRPGVSASYAIDWQLGGGAPFAFHVTNLVMHAVAACLAFVTLRRWIGASLPAFFAALLFAVHPTKAESVAWIAGRTDVLCAVAMLIATQGVARRLSGRRGGLALEAIGTALAYATKEQAVTLFAFVAVEAWVALGRPAIDAPVLRRLARAAAPQLALAVGYVIGRSVFFPIRPSQEGALGFVQHAAEVLETTGRYAALTFAPHDLSVQQGLMRAPGGRLALDTTYVLLGAAYAALLGYAAVAARKKAPGVALGIAFYVVTIFPTSNVVTTDMMTMLSERFLYLPLLGLAFAGGLLAREAERFGRRGVGAAAAAACVATLALGTMAVRRSSDFQDEDRFWARELALQPDSLEALRFQIQSEMGKKHFGRALDYVARAQAAAARDYPQTGYEVDFIVHGVQLLLATIPDHDAKLLRRVDDFLASVSSGDGPGAALDAGALRIQLPLGGGTMKKRVEKQRPRVLALRAGIQSRLSDDDAAVSLAEAAVGLCPGCLDVSRTAALVSARAGRYERAHGIVEAVSRSAGDAAVDETRNVIRSAERARNEASAAPTDALRLQLRATELCTLEAWGRAFDVLAPAKGEIEKAPDFALGFAELAWRAGEFKIARDVLAAFMPPDAVHRTTRGWSIKMGWIEEPRERPGQSLPL